MLVIRKQKKARKNWLKKTQKASLQAGLYIAEKAEEIGARIRAYSKHSGDHEDSGENKVSANDETPIQEWHTSSDEKTIIQENDNSGLEVVSNGNENDRTENKDDINKQVDDNNPPQGNKECCVVL
eukprot:UN07640